MASRFVGSYVLHFFFIYGINFYLGNPDTVEFSGNNWPLRGAKFTMWEGGSRVPAMIHSPSLLGQGEVSDLWLHVTDWFPTILSMAGLTPSQTDLDGIDQWKQLQATLSVIKNNNFRNTVVGFFITW